MVKPDIHVFEYNYRNFMFDINTCETMEITPIAFTILKKCGTLNEEEIIHEMVPEYHIDAVKEVLREIRVLMDNGYLTPYKPSAHRRILPADTERSRPLEMVMVISQKCNMGCKYCFAGQGEYGQQGMMTEKIALKAIDYLVCRSERMNQRLQVNFFGGEPLLNFSVMRKTSEYIEKINREKGMRITMQISTNGTILNDEILECLKRHDISVVVSIDGPRGIHNKWRKFRNGKGTYDTVVKNVKRMNEYLNKRVAARATLTKDSPPIAEISSHFMELGFENMVYSMLYEYPTCNGGDYIPYKGIGMTEQEVKNFYNNAHSTVEEIVKNTEESEISCLDKSIIMKGINLTDGQGPRRYYCCAGFDEIAVGIEGDIYPCQRFLDLPAYKLGNVLTGLDEESFASFYNSFDENRQACTKCWARNLCGRGCFRDASSDGCTFSEPDEKDCELKLKIFERRLFIQSEIKKHLPDLLKKNVDPRRIK